MSLLLIVILATIFLSAIFFAEKFLSFLPETLLSSARSSATFPYFESGNDKPVFVFELDRGLGDMGANAARATTKTRVSSDDVHSPPTEEC